MDSLWTRTMDPYYGPLLWTPTMDPYYGPLCERAVSWTQSLMIVRESRLMDPVLDDCEREPSHLDVCERRLKVQQ